MKHLLSEICSGSLLTFLDKYEIDLVEVSDGSFDIEHSKKLEYISRLAERGTVISEVGSKKKDVVYSPDEWVCNDEDRIGCRISKGYCRST